MQRFFRLLSFLAILLAPVFVPVLAHAQSVTTAVPVVSQTTVLSRNAANLNKTGTTALSVLHTRCDTEITNRISSLNNSTAKINAINKLTESQKQQYLTSIQTNVSGLTTLKAKCDADTDASTLTADTKSVFSTFRVYAVFMPQTSLLVAADKLSTTAGQLSDLATKFQTRLSEAQSANVTTLQSLLTDMQTQITTAQTQANSVISQVSPVQPTTYNANPAVTGGVFTSSRTNLKTGTQAVQKAVQDAMQIVASLRLLGIGVKTGTNSATTGMVPSVIIPSVVQTSSQSAK
ncbi:MAG TPA: hypothetical protein VMR41_04685 [Patescibacteria group bacterium]|nr:hypothetical protein [Patescibacteria group bacterium]